MHSRRRVRGAVVMVIVLLCALSVAGLAQVRQRFWARYEREMQDPVEDPPDAGRKGDFALGRLRYASSYDRGNFRWRWGIDANRGDRLFIGLLSRLTRIDAEPIETIIDIDSDDVFNLPFLVAISIGDWKVSREQGARLRQYFERGGFLLVDDFHNEREWANFMAGMHQIDPETEAEELAGDDPAFHVIFDLNERIRVPGANVVHGSGIERGGIVPHWRAIRDSKGRMMVAISFNQDLGDGWEFADDPYYPERYSTEAIRIGTSYAVYAMTH